MSKIEHFALCSTLMFLVITGVHSCFFAPSTRSTQSVHIVTAADVQTAYNQGKSVGWNDRKSADLKVIQGAYSTAEHAQDAKTRKTLANLRDKMEER